MNKEEQIEEMAKTLCEDYGNCKNCTLINPECENPCTVEDDCEKLYNAEYRKASDIAREIFEEIEYLIWQNDTHPASELREGIAELKKKYTETEKDDGKV